MLKLPDWAKFALTVIIGTVGVMVWADQRFVSRVEYLNHVIQQSIDTKRISDTQKDYAIAEMGTAARLAEMNSKLAVIEARQLMVLEKLSMKHQ